MAPFRISSLGAALLAAALLAAPAASAQGADSDGCSGAIARWQEMAGRENEGGHMDVSVFDKIQNEIDRAAHLCEAGEDAQARRAVTESMRRHGY